MKILLRGRRLPLSLHRLLSIESLFAALILLPHLILVFQHANVILEWFPEDDAFYYFQTARNIAGGYGPTFDGMALTNGFHPLWMLICIPIFKLASLNPILPLRLIILIAALLHLASTITLYRLAKRSLSPSIACIAAFSWAMTGSIYQITVVGGLETGLSAFLLLSLLNQASLFAEDSPDRAITKRTLFGLGLLASMTLLARLDNVFIVGVISLWILIVLCNSSPQKWFEPTNLKRFVINGFIYALPILVLVGTYLAWNFVLFGSIFPISGQVKQWWGEMRNTVYGIPPDTLQEIYYQTFTSSNRDLVPFAPLYEKTTVFVQWINSVLISIGLPAWLKSSRLFLLLSLLFLTNIRRTIRTSICFGLVPLTIACIFHVAYYKLTGHVAQRSWYWISELLLVVMFISLWLHTALELIRNTKLKQMTSQTFAVFICAWLAISAPQQILNRADTETVQPHRYLQQAAWLENQTQSGDRIGMTGSGILGYFTNERTIVNLDGLINGVAYFTSLKNGTADRYLLEAEVTYIFGNSQIIEMSEPYRQITENRIQPIAEDENGNVLWRFSEQASR